MRSFRLRRRLPMVAASVLALLVLANGANALTPVTPAQGGTTPSSFAAAGGYLTNVSDPYCNYTVSQEGATLVATTPSGSQAIDSAGDDIGAFLNSLLASRTTVCVAAGYFDVASVIEITHMEGAALVLDPGVVFQATSVNKLLQVYASPRTTIMGGEWIGTGTASSSGLIRIQFGSNYTVVEGAQVTNAGLDGILIFDNVRPNFHVSILDDTLNNNGRYGVQEFSNTSAGITGTLISGNVVLNNGRGGIYTNGIAGVTISDNIVRNTAWNGPGRIGIGVTNGYNDTVTGNVVGNMEWMGIQAYYNNYTVISNNISALNAGTDDQSGITNDHSSFSKIVGNVVESNGLSGIYIERSWNVTISGNLADANGGYGISLYHGSDPTLGGMAIVGNVCSYNGLGGIILNSAVDDVISTNECYNNLGIGIILYNDLGQVGSTGNLVSDNWLGNQANTPQTQTIGVLEMNNSGDNVVTSNVMANNTESAAILVGNAGASG